MIADAALLVLFVLGWCVGRLVLAVRVASLAVADGYRAGRGITPPAPPALVEDDNL